MSSRIPLSHVQALGLREAIRPLGMPPGSPIEAGLLIALHEKILMVLVDFDTSNATVLELELTREDVLLINQFLSQQDGDWAAAILRMARRALHELRTGILPAWAEDNEAISKMMERTQADGTQDAGAGTTGS
jgi:hypothetical protein